jgi:hypothetical protein
MLVKSCWNKEVFREINTERTAREDVKAQEKCCGKLTKLMEINQVEIRFARRMDNTEMVNMW